MRAVKTAADVGSRRSNHRTRKVAILYAKNAVNIGRVPHAYLDVSFATKSRVGVNVFPLREDSANGIEGLVPGFFAREMEEVDDGTVEFTETKIVAANILRQLRAGGGDDRLKTCVSFLHGMNAIGADEVQTESRVDHGADHERLDFPAFVFQDSICRSRAHSWTTRRRNQRR